MATVYVSVGPAGAPAENDPIDVFVGNRITSETITSSATTATGAIVADGPSVAQVFCASAVYATTGPSATVAATATNGLYCPAGIVSHLGLKNGDSVAVIDA